jgi:hypothetical protein
MLWHYDDPAVCYVLLPIKNPAGAAHREMKTNSRTEVEMLRDRAGALLLVERFYGRLADIDNATFADVSDIDV